MVHIPQPFSRTGRLRCITDDRRKYLTGSKEHVAELHLGLGRQQIRPISCRITSADFH